MLTAPGRAVLPAPRAAELLSASASALQTSAYVRIPNAFTPPSFARRPCPPPRCGVPEEYQDLRGCCASMGILNWTIEAHYACVNRRRVRAIGRGFGTGLGKGGLH